MKTSPKNKAWIANYPMLHHWLKEHNALCLWQLPGPGPGQNMEGYRIGARIFIVTIYPNQGGWDIWTNCESNQIDETLADAERRLGLNTQGTPTVSKP